MSETFKQYKRTEPDWKCAYPDERNRLIEEAREILAVLVRPMSGSSLREKAVTVALKRARKWLKETA